MSTISDTFNGGRNVIVAKKDGSTETVFVRQLDLEEYPKVLQPTKEFPAGIYSDEFALTAFLCGKDKKWLFGAPPEKKDALTPESYEQLQAAAWEVNERGFFSFANRIIQRGEKRLAEMPPEIREKMIGESNSARR